MTVRDIAEGLDSLKPAATSVTITHYYAGVVIEDQHGTRMTLEDVTIDDAGQVSAHGRPLGKNGKPLNRYPRYVMQGHSQWRVVDGGQQ